MATWLLKMPLSGADGSTSIGDDAGRTVTVHGGAALMDWPGASGDSALLINDSAKYLSIPASADFVLDGAFSFGFSLYPFVYGSCEVIDIAHGMTVTVNSSGRVIVDTVAGGFNCGIWDSSVRCQYLITRDAAGNGYAFKNGVLVDSFTIGLDPLGNSYTDVQIGRATSAGFSGLIDDVFLIDGEAIHTANYTATIGMPSLSSDPPPAESYSVALPLQVNVLAPYNVSLPLAVSVADARVFGSAVGSVTWSATVRVGGVDISARLVGQASIEAAEDSARLATLQVIPDSPAELAAFESSAVTIDVLVSGGGYSASARRFTGWVETVEFSPADRVATLSCRDGYQERIKACRTADAVRQLFGGMEQICDRLIPWVDGEPDPEAYFWDGLATVPGATFVDSAGVWRAVRWSISGPALTYGEADIFGDAFSVTLPARSEMPSAVVASFTHTFPRLHNVEVDVTWESFPQVWLVEKGLANAQVSVVREAVSSISDWYPKGDVDIGTIPLGVYPVLSDGLGALMVADGGPDIAKSLSATLYRRWYQMIERRYTVTIDMGGSSDRDESISHALKTTFDYQGWETAKSVTAPIAVYAELDPGTTDPEPPTGYEALPEPWPPAGGVLDAFGDLTEADVQAAARQVVAEAVRVAAAGRRGQRVTLERPIDLRTEIGCVININAYGVSGAGQLQSFVETLNFETAEIIGQYVLACPLGNSTVTDSSASVAIDTPLITHAFPPEVLQVHVGKDLHETDLIPRASDYHRGWLVNTAPGASHYGDAMPGFVPQFRIIMPEISQTHRDPVSESAEISASIELAGAGLTIEFD